MKSRAIARYSIILIILAALSACGDLDTMISTSDSYTVGAFASERDLAENPIISATSSIRPYYAPESINDPDVVALKVLLRDPSGRDVATAVEYRERKASVRSPEAETAEPIIVDRLTDSLPAFSFPADLKVGRFVLVFQLLGEDGVLFEESKKVFYIGANAFSVSSIASYPPGSGPSAGAPVFRNGVPLLLEAVIDTGPDLDPYIVWTFAGKTVSAARVAEGGHRLLWTTPKDPGFYRLEATLYPAPPDPAESAGFAGLSRSRTLATSLDAPYPGLVGADTDYRYIYRFLGDLKAQATASEDAIELLSVHSAGPLWTPHLDGYGLALGPVRSFRSARTAIPVAEGALIPSVLSFLVVPEASGTIWSAVFEAEDPEDSGLLLGLSIDGSRLVLTLSSGGSEVVVGAELGAPFDGSSRLIEILLEPKDGSLAANLRIDGIRRAEAALEKLPLLSGTGSSIFGGGIAAAGETGGKDRIVAILDDFATADLPPSDPVEAAATATLPIASLPALPPNESIL